MGQKKIFAVVRVLNGVGLIVRALHKDAFSQEKFRCIFLSSYLFYRQDITYRHSSIYAVNVGTHKKRKAKNA